MKLSELLKKQSEKKFSLKSLIRFFVFCLLAFYFQFSTFNCFAQSPQLFQYQAVVRDGSGNPVVSQNVGFQISIISGSLTGTVVYSETHSASTNAFGVVTLNIGSGTPVSGTFSAIVWGTASHFIKVEADPTGGTSYLDMGTTQLLSVPYALYSENSGNIGDTVWSKTGNNIYNNNTGNIGIGTNAPTRKVVIKADPTVADSIPIFEIRNKIGQQVMSIYNDSIRFFISDMGSNRGGFAVSGRNNAKSMTNDFLRINADSARIYTGDSIKGFGVKNIGTTSKTSYMKLTPDNYFIGHQTGNSISSGKYNSFIGYQAGYNNNVGSRNYFLGYRAGYNNLNGYSNIFIGDSAGFFNTGGFKNIFVGNQSGANSINGTYDVFLGYQSGYYNLGSYYDSFTDRWTGSYNVYLGYQAGYSNTEGIYNVATGYQALYSNQGSSNAAYGTKALYANTTGGMNSALGQFALESNTSGSHNTALGSVALSNNLTGEDNIGVGYSALSNNTVGSDNIAIGNEALRLNTLGNGNVATGTWSLYGNTTGNYNSAFGYHALSGNTGNNNIAFGFYALSGNSGSENIGIGSYTMNANYTGSNNVAIGANCLYTNVTGSNNTALGYNAFYNVANGGSILNSTALGANSVITADNQVRIGDNTVTSIGGFADWTNVSDKRFKKNIQKNVPGLDFILKLEPVTYNLDMNSLAQYLHIPDSLRNKQSESVKGNMLQTGFIAQDVEKIANELGFDFSGVDKPKNSNDFYGLRYAEFTVPLVKAVQEQQKQIEEQKKMIELQNIEIKDMQKQINELKKK